jgi:hypothetical protein
MVAVIEDALVRESGRAQAIYQKAHEGVEASGVQPSL